ncbi:unnamed protein product, partial [Ectocarpus sp. 12 AP-2014]
GGQQQVLGLQIAVSAATGGRSAMGKRGIEVVKGAAAEDKRASCPTDRGVCSNGIAGGQAGNRGRQLVQQDGCAAPPHSLLLSKKMPLCSRVFGTLGPGRWPYTKLVSPPLTFSFTDGGKKNSKARGTNGQRPLERAPNEETAALCTCMS